MGVCPSPAGRGWREASGEGLQIAGDRAAALKVRLELIESERVYRADGIYRNSRSGRLDLDLNARHVLTYIALVQNENGPPHFTAIPFCRDLFFRLVRFSSPSRLLTFYRQLPPGPASHFHGYAFSLYQDFRLRLRCIGWT